MSEGKKVTGAKPDAAEEAAMTSVIVPFTGFYESDHNDLLDETLAQMTQDDSGDPLPGFEGLSNHVDWRKVYLAYVQAHLARFCEEFKHQSGQELTLKFVELSSPREYNFTTDKIEADVPVGQVERLLKVLLETEPFAMTGRAKKDFTSRDGFISFYDPDWETWGAPCDWEPQQVGCLLRTWLDTMEPEGFMAHNLMEYERGNSVLDSMIYEAMDDEGKTLVNKASEMRNAGHTPAEVK